MLLHALLLCAGLLSHSCAGFPSIGNEEPSATDSVRDDAVSRKVLGSSVVTSVSVIMDTGSEKLYSDAVGKPQTKPQSGSQVASPINLLNPDRYEFYTFSDSGDLVKRLMTLSEIQGIIANADGEAFNHNSHNPEKKVNDVVSNVQNVLKGEIEKGGSYQYNASNGNIVLDTPDVSSSWSVILPAIFGNSGEEIKAKPARPQQGMTPETIMVDETTVPIVKKPEGFTKITTKATTTTTTTTEKVPTTTEQKVVRKPSTYRPSTYKVPTTTLKAPTTTRKPLKVSTTKRVSVRTTPTTAIPRITTRGTRPRRTTTTTTTTSTQVPTIIPEVVTEQFRVPETTSGNVAEASSHFIQLFDPILSHTQATQAQTKKPIFIRTTPRTPVSSEGALFIIDQKTNTRIPITTKEQLSSLLNKLESTTISTSQVFKATPGFANANTNHEPLITLNSINGHQVINNQVQDSIATTSNLEAIQSTTSGFADVDIDKYQQLLLTSTNIYEINKELAKSTTTTAIPTTTITRLVKPIKKIPTTTTTTTTTSTTTTKPLVTTSEAPDIFSSTLKDSNSNLVNSIEQLIQQAVGNIQEVATATTTTKVVNTTSTTLLPTTDEVISTSTTNIPTTEEVSTEVGTSTILPNLTGFPQEDFLINEAMGSLLSQVVGVGSDFQGLTTLTDLPSVSTTENFNKPIGDIGIGENLEFRIKTTDIFSETTESSTITINTSDGNYGERITTEGKTDSDSDLIQTTEADKDKTTNEILNTDATSYSVNNLVTSTDSLDSTTITEVPEVTDKTKIPEVVESTTQEIIKDLPIVYDLGLHGFVSDDGNDGTITEFLKPLTNTITTTDKKVIQDEETIEKVEDFVGTTSKPVVIPEMLGVTTDKIPEDSDSLPSTNNYKEVTSNTNTADDSSTLSIDDLIKELTNRDEDNNKEQPEVEKETTVLIITKPLYSTTTSTTTEVPRTTEKQDVTKLEVFKQEITKPEVLGNLNSETSTTSNTEAISLDAIASNTEVNQNPTTDSLWMMVSTIAPHNISEVVNKTTPLQNTSALPLPDLKLPQPSRPVELNPMPQLGGLEETTKHLDQDIYQFVALCNELAFGFWKSVTTGISSARSVVLSPFAATSLLAMVFLGARGATSGEMNEILRLDDMVTFNPHLIFRNVSESIGVSKIEGVATSVILRELYSDKSKGHLLNFYKERAKAFYDGHVEEVSFKEIGDVVRRRTNLIVKKLTDGKIQEYVKDSGITVKSPLAGVSASIFQTDCSNASVEGRDGELYFVVLPSIRQRRLVPVPAAVWRSDFLAGYDPLLDATAVSLGNKEQIISTIFVIPGQQGIAAPGDGLARLERSLIGGAFKDKSWSRLLQTLIPRPGLEVQIPRFQHRSIINATVALQQMGMKDLFDASKADLRGLNGVANDLYLSDILQINNFATCGEESIGEAHHSEIYPATANRTYRRSRKFKDTLPPEGAYYDSELSEEPRDYQRAFHDPLHDPSLYALPLPLRPRQARLPDPPRLRFDRPFLYFVRHNPTGLILHMGRFNPRLLP